MADIFVDRILQRNGLKEVWFELTKKMFKNFEYYKVLELPVTAELLPCVPQANGSANMKDCSGSHRLHPAAFFVPLSSYRHCNITTVFQQGAVRFLRIVSGLGILEFFDIRKVF